MGVGKLKWCFNNDAFKMDADGVEVQIEQLKMDADKIEEPVEKL